MKLNNLYAASFDRRAGLHEAVDTDCYRLVNMEGDGLPGVTVDRYNEFILVQYFHEEFSREKDHHVRALEETLSRLPVPIRGVLLKNRTRVSETEEIQDARISELLSGELPADTCTVKQNGVLAGVDLVSAQNTGLFLDMREVRDMLPEYYPSAPDMLNLFSYTGIFSVHALKNGAAGSINVDLSKPVLARAMENYRLNNLPVDNRDFIYGDALQWVKIFGKKGRRFSFVVFDPPSFSRNKKGVFSVRKHFADFCKRIDGVMEGGYVLTSTNQVSVTKDEYLSWHPGKWKPVFFARESSDFPFTDRPCLKAGLWKV